MVYYANQRGLQLVDWEMNKDVANLFYAKYGRRDAQDQCGYGQNTNARIIGTTSILGMTDTVNPDHKTEWCWYKTTDEYGSDKYVQIASCNCLGYENWFGNKAEWMDKVNLPNSPSSEQYKLYIEMPDGTIITGKTSSLLGASAACLLNALKYLGGIPKDVTLISPEIIEPIQHLKVEHLGNHNQRLHTAP